MKKITIYKRDDSDGDHIRDHYLYLDRRELELLADHHVNKQGFDMIVYYMQGDCNLEHIPKKGYKNVDMVSQSKDIFYSQDFLAKHKEITYAVIEFRNSYVYSDIDEDITIIQELARKVQSPLPPNQVEDLGSLVRRCIHCECCDK